MSLMEKAPEARPGSLDVAHDASITWRYMAPAGHTLEMCKRPDYWKNVIREVGQQRTIGRHAWNRIEIIAEDGTWEADLRVLGIDGSNLVTTRVIREWTDPKAAVKLAVPKGYLVEHITGNGWRALAPGGDIILTGKATEQAAIADAIDHVRRAKG